MSNWYKDIKDIINGVPRIAQEKDKAEVVESVIHKLQDPIFTHSDKSEIVNRIVLRLFEQKKEDRTRLLKEARELQESLTEINIPNQK
tara:strand:- start:697 stop:960 length:264 start_codon:yes stop_codon:yes gene_type:complete